MSGGALILALMLVRLFVRTRNAHHRPPRLATRSWTAWRGSRIEFFTRCLWHGRKRSVHGDADGPSGIVFPGPRGAAGRLLGVSGSHRPLRPLASPDGAHRLHIAGALYHTFVRKDGLLRRNVVWPARTRPSAVGRRKKPISGASS